MGEAHRAPAQMGDEYDNRVGDMLPLTDRRHGTLYAGPSTFLLALMRVPLIATNTAQSTSDTNAGALMECTSPHTVAWTFTYSRASTSR